MATQFCCCTSNLFTAKILAIVFVVLHVVQLGLAVFGLAKFNDIIDIFIDEGLKKVDDVETLRLLFKVILGLAGAYLVVDLFLLVGAFKKVPCLLWFWMVVNGFSIFCILCFLISTIIISTAGNIIVIVILTLLTVWAMLAVYGSIQEIKEERQAEMDFYANQAKDF